MSLTLAVDDSNDLYLAPNGDIATASGLVATLQACEHAARTILAEKIYATDEGVPYFETVWNGSPNVPQFEAYLRRELLRVDDVLGVNDLTVTVAAGTLTYVAVIRTAFGTGTING